MKQGDIYLHYKGNEYTFEGIAYPLDLNENLAEFNFVCNVLNANTPDGEVISVERLYEKDNFYYIVGDSKRVLYYSSVEYEQGNFWCRCYDNFFSDVRMSDGVLKKRFKLIS